MTKLFLSHSHEDKAFAVKLCTSLQREGIDVWIDNLSLSVGDSLFSKIGNAISESDFLGVVLSPNSVSSEWVQSETYIALNQEISGEKIKVLPILYKTCKIPEFLSTRVYADFTKDFSLGYKQLMAQVIKDRNERKSIIELPSTKIRENERITGSCIRLTSKNDSDFIHETYDNTIGIGRAPNNDVRLEGLDVSWYHGYIENITGKYQYHHLSKTNPTIIRRQNQEYLLKSPRLTELTLQNNDRILIGNTILIVEFDIKAGPEGYVTTEKEKQE